MVHRPADSRLLTNLLSHEKEYSKHLITLLDYSQSSLASFSAYASASAPPASHAILAVAGAFAGADDALRRYAVSVDEWRDHLKSLKSLEDEVGDIMRDREILVTRLIKVSKSQKPTRESFLVNQTFPSSSSLSVKSDFSGSLNPSSKLSAAQSELQACEAHLAVKERELHIRRAGAVREGLAVRCNAMVECGWVWGEMGKEALMALGNLSNGEVHAQTRPPLTHQPHPLPLSPSNFDPNPNQHQNPSQQSNKPLPDPNRPSSDLSSVAPSQSASQIALPADSTHIYSDANFPSYASSSTHSHSQQSHTQTLQIPPAHAIPELAFPTSIPTPYPIASSSQLKHTLSRRITEEDLIQLHAAQLEQMNQGEEEPGGDSSDGEDEARLVHIVENARFMDRSGSMSSPQGRSGRKFSIRGGAKALVPADIGSSTSLGGGGRERKTSIGAGFFGSLKGLFGGKTQKDDWYMGANGGSVWGRKMTKSKGMGSSRMWSDDERERGSQVRIVPVGTGSPGSGSTGRGRVVSDAAVGASPRGGGGKRLRKGRVVKKKGEEDVGGPGAGGETVVDAAMNLDANRDGVKKAEEWVGGQVRLRGESRERNSHENGDAEVGQGEKGWMSDGDVSVTVVERGNGGRGGARNKSKGKGKKKANGTETETETENILENSSLKGAGSESVSRRASLGARPTSGVPQNNVVGTGNVKGKSVRGARTATVEAAAAASGGVSLMSIVEGVTRGNREGWSVGGTSKVAGGGVGEHAVVVAADTESERGHSRSGSGVEVPRAPGSVFDVVPASTSANGGELPTSVSAPELVGPAVGIGGGSKRPAKSPLRSALRNTSRSSSPAPAQSQLPLASTPVPEPAASIVAPPPALIPMINGVTGNHDVQRIINAAEDDDESDDGASVSSYETGHEMFSDGEGDNTEHERDHPPPPPPHDHDYQRPHTPPVQDHVVSLENHAINSVQNHGDGSDISASTASTSAPAPPQQRRKSVRVSLQPTFSPTPPALDEEDGDEDVNHGPWNGHAGPRNGVVDMWEDSSEEDVEYQRAKRLLTRVARREKKNR